MHVEYAQLPPPEDSADRIFVTDNAVIVLDGATAIVPTEVSAQTYADQLGRHLVDELTIRPEGELSNALAVAIRQTARSLSLRPGKSPSSTAAIVRQRADAYDMLVLGDSAVLWGAAAESGRLIDARIDHTAKKLREEYQSHLRIGGGYGDQHHALLRLLQEEQQKQRNTDGGYWIAESDPVAAEHALTITVPQTSVSWVVLATDGAYELLKYRRCTPWPEIAALTSVEIALLLDELQEWECRVDPEGRHLPRAKRHDDKALAVTRSHHGWLTTPARSDQLCTPL